MARPTLLPLLLALALLLGGLLSVQPAASTGSPEDNQPDPAFSEQDSPSCAAVTATASPSADILDPNNPCSAVAQEDRFATSKPPEYGTSAWWLAYQSPFVANNAVRQAVRDIGSPNAVVTTHRISPSPTSPLQTQTHSSRPVNLVTYRDSFFSSSSASSDRDYYNKVSSAVSEITTLYDKLSIPITWTWDVVWDGGVYNTCDMQTIGRFEKGFSDAGDMVLIFSGGKVTQPDGTRTHGLSIENAISKRYNSGAPATIHNDCGGSDIAPIMPVSYADGTFSFDPATTFARETWALHEVGHMFTMAHGDASCWTSYHGHATLEAATSAGDRPSNCQHWWITHFHRTFTGTTNSKMQAEYQNWVAKAPPVA